MSDMALGPFVKGFRIYNNVILYYIEYGESEVNHFDFTINMYISPFHDYRVYHMPRPGNF